MFAILCIHMFECLFVMMTFCFFIKLACFYFYIIILNSLQYTALNDEVEDALSAKLQQKKRLARAKLVSKGLLGVLFVAMTGTAVFAAIKCVMFEFPVTVTNGAKTVATVMMALGPVLVNIELGIYFTFLCNPPKHLVHIKVYN